MQTPKIRYREVSETSPEAEDQSLVLRGELISDVVVWRTDLPSNVVILEATEKKCFFGGLFFVPPWEITVLIHVPVEEKLTMSHNIDQPHRPVTSSNMTSRRTYSETWRFCAQNCNPSKL